ncbi:hypothetical protein [Burkholderia sp. BCC0097]|uniref:hypothetical protein n=1 Tax=Burkholderia sp. BCC0097 TaxID=2676289 RepID=UPI00158ED330|nr:hypothetical protein [Burkholderia sp. BCC0097]
MSIFIRRIILSIFMLGFTLSSGAQTFSPRPGPVNSGANRYNYAPAIIYDSSDSKWKAWWCGLNISTGAGDGIWYAESWDSINWYADLSNLSAGTSTMVFAGSGGSNWDSSHTCDPHVLRNVSVAGAVRNYVLFYTGANNLGDNGGQIGVAFSSDGRNWTRYGPLTLGCETASELGCQHFSVVHTLPNNPDPAGGRFVAVFTQIKSPDTGVYRVESWDGINWTAKTKLCFDASFGGCNAAPGVDIAYDRTNNRYIFAFDASVNGPETEYLYSAPATWYGTIGGDPQTAIASFVYTGLSPNGSGFGPPGIFKTDYGYLTQVFDHIYTMFSDRDPHQGWTQLVQVQWQP